MSEKPVMGFAWYDEASFGRLRDVMPDMSERYDEWRHAALRDVRRAEEAGYRVIRIALRPDEFLAWCRQHGLTCMDLETRRAFARDRAQLVLRAERLNRKSFSFF
ncbi:hypothetical protein [Teichococcus oryzae]|uniref:Uncharacterized protein n=1 Tax=Teichococcus oryzae TaxID=1608942 RepID=A0A5B2TFX4_9PROT|nr:hypothetical protein [Pseudoroseomonas oryzae]KAA2212788.1 hypothetical protein F0Q34_13920 [Pseudoroseomonas oryzae]